MKDVYLYFSDDFNPVKASTTTADQLATINNGAPFVDMPSVPITLAEAQAGEGWLHEGACVLTLDAAHKDGGGDDHLFGTHYGTVVDDQADITVSPYAVEYAEGTGDGDFTIRTVAQDPVYGITQSTTAGENGFKLTLKKPFGGGSAFVIPSSSILNVYAGTATQTLIALRPTVTNDTGDVDTITLTHTSGEQKRVAESLSNVLTNPRNQGKLIKWCDLFHGNPSTDAGVVSIGVSWDS